MYFTTDSDEIEAVDAASGARRWSYTPSIDFILGNPADSGGPVSRGVSVGAGLVFAATYDDRLLALSARTGKLVWETSVADPARGAAETSPGTYWHGEIIVGGPAGDSGLRGFVAAYDARTGRRLWQTFMVGASRRRGADADTYGGGDVWMPPTVDPQSGTVYVGTGNPTPAFSLRRRPGCDRWTDATVALNARTGRILWGHTEFCNDSWDYDTDESPMILRVDDHGVRLTLVGDGNKSGFYTVLNARTGSLVARSPMLTRFSRPHRAPSVAGADVCPGPFGGLEYGPPAYDPRTGLVYATADDMCARIVLDRPVPTPGPGLGGTATPLGRARGVVAAVNPLSGRLIWRRRLPAPAVGGALATKSGLVLVGDDDGYLYAFRSTSGTIVWRFRVGLRFGSAPVAYSVGGREYIAIVGGGSQIPDTSRAGNRGVLIVLALAAR